ncbi:MAG: transcriptional regulator FtrA [Pseudomonadota bacterium]
MTKTARKKETARNRRVAALVYDGLCTFEFAIVSEIFGLKRPEVGDDWYSFEVIAAEAGSLAAQGGISITAKGNLQQLASVGTLVVPGWRGIHTPVPGHITEAVQAAYARGTRLVSICSGAFVLAAAGLLDGRRATTHWAYAEAFREQFPDVNLDVDRIYTEQDNILTSAGSSAGIDVCLHIVREDFGAEIANSVARRLVMHSHRQGDQAQFIEQPVPADYEAHRLSDTIAFVREHIDQPHSIESLARVARMGERTFQRRFRALVGMPVGQWLIRERVTRASELLETSDAALEAVSTAAGFGNPGVLQYHFRKSYGVSPGQYRRQFSARD